MKAPCLTIEPELPLSFHICHLLVVHAVSQRFLFRMYIYPQETEHQRCNSRVLLHGHRVAGRDLNSRIPTWLCLQRKQILVLLLLLSRLYMRRKRELISVLSCGSDSARARPQPASSQPSRGPGAPLSFTAPWALGASGTVCAPLSVLSKPPPGPADPRLCISA